MHSVEKQYYGIGNSSTAFLRDDTYNIEAIINL